ncbi:MAG TPA: helix-hairpin-helix domain-containing protein, partial [Dehalococcoidia bacterium]|nr:helix-hairpin-helix domain-containing protein [Dehalococcoidia bacterium]
DAGVSQDLTWDHVLTLEGLGNKSINKLLAAVDDSKRRPLPNVLFALGIRHVGYETAELLVQRFGSMGNLREATAEELMAVPSIGPKVAESIVAYFESEQNRQIAEKLRRAGVILEAATPQPRARPLAGQEDVFTGRLERFTRSNAESLVKELGAATGSNVTRKTTYVVLGEDPGSKAERAHQLGITTLTEEEFLKLVDETKQSV